MNSVHALSQEIDPQCFLFSKAKQINHLIQVELQQIIISHYPTLQLCSYVYVFNRTAIGYWLLAFGFLAN